MHLGDPESNYPLSVYDVIRADHPEQLGHGYLETIKWGIPEERIVWSPKCFPNIKKNPAHWYMVLMALYWRVNGASDLFSRYRVAFGSRGALPKGDVTGTKVKEFVDRHLALAMYLDTLDDPRDGVLPKEYLDVPSGGPTDFTEDRDTIGVTKTQIQLQDTPLQVLAKSGVFDDYELDDFAHPNVEHILAHQAKRIREMGDEELTRLFVPTTVVPPSTVGEQEEEEWEGADALDFYYPVKMVDAQACRDHSWYLACLVVINRAWEETAAREDPEKEDEGEIKEDPDGDEDEEEEEMEEEDDEEEEEDDDDDDDVAVKVDPNERAKPVSLKSSKIRRPPVKWKHSASIRYAFHRIMGSFVQLMYNAVKRKQISDESWRLRPDEKPTMLDLYFPHDTVCFHAGDLPSLDGLLDQVGLYGVQAVKNKIPLVRMLMKSLPVCCQSRDLVGCFVTECRLMNGEGYWRTVRAMFYCTMVGLYPHSEHRVDIRSAIRIYHMLFIDREVFFSALEKEALKYEAAKKLNPALKKTNKTCQLVYVAFREFFIHSVENESEWLSVVDQRIKWDDFVDNTVNMADEMRRCARFASAPPGDEILFAINALWRCKGEYGSDVYRYRKKEYVATIAEKINRTRVDLHGKKRIETEEIHLIRALLDRLVEGEILVEEDLKPLMHSRHLGTLRTNRATGVMHRTPIQLYRVDPSQFAVAADKALEHAYERHMHLMYVVDNQIYRNITNFLLRTRPDDRLKFDCLLDPRLGGVSRESVQTMAKTFHIYMTRSSPKSIGAHIQNLQIRDLCIFAAYFNVVARLEKFNLIPLDAETVSRQAKAMRKYRYHLLDDEPLPPGAFNIYVTFCCRRVATFSNMPTYGNFAISYDPLTRNMVCSKKVARTARIRNKPPEEPPTGESKLERVKKETESRNKKARIDTKDDNSLPCDGQPVLCVDLWGMALEYEGERYLFCPQCGQLHIYSELGWGRRGYMCKTCRNKETPLSKLERCAYCGQADRGHVLKTLEIIAPSTDPCNPEHRPLEDPLSCYQTLHFCQADANSAGLFGKYPTDRLYNFTAKDKLWNAIGPANSARTIANYKKYN